MGKITAKQIKEIIHEKIPNGLIIPEHSEDGHFYRHTPTDSLLHSVTTKSSILDNSPHLKQWAAKMAVDYIDKRLYEITPDTKDDIYKAAQMAHRDIFQDAGDIGTTGHGFVEDYLTEWLDTGKRPEDIRTFIKGDIKIIEHLR